MPDIAATTTAGGLISGSRRFLFSRELLLSALYENTARYRLLFAILHRHGPAECPALSEQLLAHYTQSVSDKTADSHGVKVIHRWVDVNCTSNITGHLFGAPIHHSVFIVESEKKENVQNFANQFPSEVVGVRSLSG